MTQTLIVIAYFSALILVAVNINKYMHIFQQSFYEYDEFLPALKTTRSLKSGIYEAIIFCVSVCSVLIPSFLYLLIAINLFVAVTNINNRVVAKKKFVYTKRVKITYVVIALVLLVTMLGVFNISKLEYGALVLVPLSMFKYFSVFMILLGNLLAKPILSIGNKKYIKEAKEIIASNKKMKIIGITGSYGKTSTKNIVSALLEEKFITVMTPKSYNTTLGVVKTIREEIKPYTEVFVCEMGAARLGEIKEICEIATPDISVITSIGPQHLTSFKSIENVEKGKFEIVTYSKPNATAILNIDNEYIRDGIEKYATGKNIIEYSLDKDTRYKVENIEMSDKGSVFDIVENEYRIKVETRLLGKHNIYNIVCAVAIARELGMTNEEIKKGIRKIKPVEHRLELKNMGGVLALDDSFNSNPEGSKAAVETLCMFKDKYKVLVTPGMIELGNKTDELNEKFGEYASALDYVILVGEITTKAIVKGLKNKGFENYVVVDDIYDAFEKLQEMQISHQNLIALFENDLPDSYIERK